MFPKHISKDDSIAGNISPIASLQEDSIDVVDGVTEEAARNTIHLAINVNLRRPTTTSTKQVVLLVEIVMIVDDHLSSSA